jgi:hypothetical protein
MNARQPYLFTAKWFSCWCKSMACRKLKKFRHRCLTRLKTNRHYFLTTRFTVNLINSGVVKKKTIIVVYNRDDNF